MNFKTIIRVAKEKHFKKRFTTGGYMVACADGYIMGWEPSSEHGSWDVDDSPTEDASESLKMKTRLLINQLSPPLDEMVKVNGQFLRAAISAMEATKGKDPIYLDLKENRICLAYEKEGVVTRAVVACLKNKEDNNGSCV